MISFERNAKAIKRLWQDPIERTKLFFDRAPFFKINARSYEPYQLGAYLPLWGELYGFPRDVREVVITGRGTGKTSVLQELNAADMAVFMPYFLQFYYGKPKPVDVTIIFVGSQKKYAMERMDKVKGMIINNPYLERHLVDLDCWTKDKVDLRNRCKLRAEVSSDKARGYHQEDPEGVVLYLLEEFAFWGGSQCMSGEKFVEEVADQSFGARIGAFTTPYGKRGGAWWAWNNPAWMRFNFPTWFNPRVDRKKLAPKIKRLLAMGRQIIVDQEIRGLFCEDVGLWFTMEIWLKSINVSLEWEFDDQDNYHAVMKQLEMKAESRVRRKGTFLLGIDPNKGTKKAGADPYGVNLTEKIGRRYINRFTSAFNGRSHDEMDKMLKLICQIYNPEKVNFEGGGGYATGPIALVKGGRNVRNIHSASNSNSEIVRYMSILRALMSSGKYEQPESDSLKQSQLAMKSIGDSEDVDQGLDATEASIRFQTDGKKQGIPCDLAAMGVALCREIVSSEEVAASITSTKEVDKKAYETKRVLTGDLNRIGAMGLEGIHSRLTSVGH